MKFDKTKFKWIHGAYEYYKTIVVSLKGIRKIAKQYGLDVIRQDWHGLGKLWTFSDVIYRDGPRGNSYDVLRIEEKTKEKGEVVAVWDFDKALPFISEIFVSFGRTKQRRKVEKYE